MNWTYNYASAALAMQFILMMMFLIRRRLPTWQNRCFLSMLICGFAATFLEFLGNYLVENDVTINTSLFHFLLILLYWLSVTRFVILYEFTLSAAKERHDIRKFLFVQYVPYLIYTIMIFTAPWNGYMEDLEESMFTRQNAYLTVLATSAIYVIFSLITIIVGRKRVSGRQLMGFYGFCIMLLLGIIFQRITGRIVSLDLFFTVMVMILSYTLQHPYFYIHKRTNLYNRDGFAEKIRERHDMKQQSACVSIQIENYRDIKRVYGNEVGTRCMRMYAQHYKAYRPKDYIFYMGSGLFSVLVRPDFDYAEFLELMQKRFEQVWMVDERKITMTYATTYVGTEIYLGGPDRIFETLDFAMDEAIRKGLGGSVVIDNDLLDRRDRDIAVEEAVARAVNLESVEVYYQPIYSVHGERINSAEALARIFDPDMGMISPEIFIEKAERNGSIVRLGAQIFEKVCIFIEEHDMEALGLEYIEVNLSPLQCMYQKLAYDFIAIADKHKVDMRYINLEITESATTDLAILKGQMEILREHGCTFSLDDYGTGFSNLSLILDLPFRIVKIDKSIVWPYFSGEKRLLVGVMRTFRGQGMKILAEGVETEEMVRMLKAMGCDYEQGYYFAAPLEERKFIRYLEGQELSE